MDRGISRPYVLIGAAALVCVLAVPLATSRGDTQARESAGASKKAFKKLKKQVNELQAQVDGISRQPGSQGQPGANGATQVVTRFAPFGTGSGNVATVSCNPGEVATGGGFNAQGNGGNATILASEPVPGNAGTIPTGWRVSVAGVAPPVFGGAYVICASP